MVAQIDQNSHINMLYWSFFPNIHTLGPRANFILAFSENFNGRASLILKTGPDFHRVVLAS